MLEKVDIRMSSLWQNCCNEKDISLKDSLELLLVLIYFLDVLIMFIQFQGDNGADMISNLRSGVAAENAVAIMQERGFSNSRRTRHRVTPGTVKFAAFHILSLEGSNGLSILDVADKIQVLSISSYQYTHLLLCC